MLIAIEGVDGAGKRTLTAGLREPIESLIRLPLASVFHTVKRPDAAILKATSYPLAVASAPNGVKAPNSPAVKGAPSDCNSGPVPLM